MLGYRLPSDRLPLNIEAVADDIQLDYSFVQTEIGSNGLTFLLGLFIGITPLNENGHCISEFYIDTVKIAQEELATKLISLSQKYPTAWETIRGDKLPECGIITWIRD
jgi:hypothetical protein